jgi:hypothetical protein
MAARDQQREVLRRVVQGYRAALASIAATQEAVEHLAPRDDFLTQLVWARNALSFALRMAELQLDRMEAPAAAE